MNALKPGRALAVILLIALAVRILFFLEWRHNPFLEHPVLDARGYVGWANEIRAGHWPWSSFRIHGPGYPHFLAAVLTLTGGSLAAATFANALLGVAWIGLLVVGVRRILPAPTAEIAGLLAAVYWPFLHFEGHLLATTWFTFLTVAAFAVLAAFPRSRSAPLRAIGAGLLLGAATVTRPNALVVLPFVLWWMSVPRRVP
ncbi:MAG: hypothetical protein HKN12_10875, partial [Gemmatimonadetes bacterium]|nr:hypothetical protein [Gemmatimonadota bacterium]